MEPVEGKGDRVECHYWMRITALVSDTDKREHCSQYMPK